MKYFLLILSIFICSGCFGSAPVKKAKVVRVQHHAAPSVTGAAVDTAALKQGGKLGFTLFKAGPQAEANDQLDRLSLLLIKGIGDRVRAQDGVLSVTEDEREADFVVEGYIEQFLQPGKFARWVMRRKNSNFSVSGEVWKKGSGQKVLTFASTRSVRAKRANIQDVAYQMGEEIGDFILEHAK